jgi:hypothetical protein
MSCAELRRWLDEGRGAEGAAPAHAHAASCATCAALLSAEEEIERLLMEPLPQAPAGFTERVMARLPARPVEVPLVVLRTPWWLRATSDPAAVLALVLAGLLSWPGGALWDVALALGTASGVWVARGLAAAAGSIRLDIPLAELRRSDVRLGLEVALACGWLLAAPWLTRLGRRAATRAVARA